MSLRFVIPAGAKPDEQAYPGRPETWAELAGDVPIENFGSAWCVEWAIDGLGFCTEASGQESDTERAAREATEAAAAAAAQTAQAKLAAAKAKLAALDNLSAPVLTADVIDVLDDLRSVL